VGVGAGLVPGQQMPLPQDLDVTVLAFAQWLSEMRARSNASLQQMLAEMGIIRNGITSNNTDLTEFKRNTATVQQQMQSQISDLRDKLTDAYTEISSMKKTKSQFEQEIHAEYQSLSEQLQFKTLELETLKKAYAHTHQQLQQQIIQLQTEVNELRMKSDDVHRQHHVHNEESVGKLSEVEMASQMANSELKRLRGDHDQAIANLAENMNRWNDALRDLSKEFHEFQKVMNVNHQRMQSTVWDVQSRVGIAGGAPGAPAAGAAADSARMEGSASGGEQRSPARTAAAPAGGQTTTYISAPRRPGPGPPPAPGMMGYGPAPGAPPGPYVMRQ